MKQKLKIQWMCFFLLQAIGVMVQARAELDAACVNEKVATLDPDVTIKTIRELCEKNTGQPQLSLDTTVSDANESKKSLIDERIRDNKAEKFNTNVLTAYKRNYYMPATYVRNLNEQLLIDNGSISSLDNLEAKFQLSFQIRINDDMFREDDSLTFGFTTEAFWQSYNRDESYPFRETSYEPEIFYGYPTKWWPFNVEKSYIKWGIVHQSNGRDRPLSRSWNRIYADFIWEHDSWVHSFKPWWRIPLKERVEGEPGGDDNPDIEKFMGNFEYRALYFWKDHEFSAMLRHNLRSDAKGALELEWVFPLWSNRLRGIMQYHNGYGESLLDYNFSTERIGIGILLTDIL